MTTIAYRDGIMASDSKVTGNEVFVGQAKKITKITVEEDLPWIDRVIFRKEPKQKTYLVGMCGELAGCLHFMDVLFFGAQQSSEISGALLVVDEDGEIMIYENGRTNGIRIEGEYAAEGSGFEVALGAMFHGATAVEAVQAAIHHDNTSGGDIQVLSFEDEDDAEE